MTRRARWWIETAGYSVALILPDGRVLAARGASVRPLYRIYTAHRADLTGATAADKVIGRAAASLLCSAGVSEAYAFLMSEGGLQLLESHGVKVGYARLVPYIKNKRGDGMCPMEAAVKQAKDIEECVQRLAAFVEAMPQEPKYF